MKMEYLFGLQCQLSLNCFDSNSILFMLVWRLFQEIGFVLGDIEHFNNATISEIFEIVF